MGGTSTAGDVLHRVLKLFFIQVCKTTLRLFFVLTSAGLTFSSCAAFSRWKIWI